MSPFDLGALLLLTAAVIGVVNDRWIGLPGPISLLVGALGFSLAIMAVDPLLPHHDLTGMARTAVETLNLPHVFLDGTLAFLLFAASLHVSLADLRKNRWAILGLASGGVILSTVIFGVLIWAALLAGGTPVPIQWCLVIGAVLAPTDAVVVEGLLRRVNLPAALKATIFGESLFNDGVGVVIFLVALSAAEGATGLIGHGAIATRLMVESVGGGAIGVVTGLMAARGLLIVKGEAVALMISLALVLTTYRLAVDLGVSGPIAVVASGLVVGNLQPGKLAEPIRSRLQALWSMIDDLLNAMLFLLIGLETVAIAWERVAPLAVVAAIPFSLVARAISVSIPMLALNIRTHDRGLGIAVLTWAGMRGGVSVALALTLPNSPYRRELWAICYTVVVFSIAVQGLTMPAFIRRLQAMQASHLRAYRAVAAAARRTGSPTGDVARRQRWARLCYPAAKCGRGASFGFREC